ncbi:unnamed protein product [Caenorhabditis bovis]|uniref:VWFA domain-containing protein n=1 Tax=Caenorhabditis bovis TaxID=2654633 RepID=A0A8S1EJQ5_9PELO|nr:unnamed protein product [Caenorhabditis bovis]
MYENYFTDTAYPHNFICFPGIQYHALCKKHARTFDIIILHSPKCRVSNRSYVLTMGLGSCIKNLKLREWLNIVLFIISIAVLITSVVLIVVFAGKDPGHEASIIYTTSLATGIQWNNDLFNPESKAFQDLSKALQANITNGWTNQKPMMGMITAFMPDSEGINFYAEYIFMGKSMVPTKTVVTAMESQGYPTNAFCYCDASNKNLLNIILVDVSVPIIGTLSDKLDTLSQFLQGLPQTINLDTSSPWSSQEFRLVAYGGNEPEPLGRAKNQADWNSIINSISPKNVNANNVDNHALKGALRYVMDNYLPTPGVAVNVLIVTDGFDFTEMGTISSITDVLKKQYFYSIDAIVMSTSQLVRMNIQPLVSDFYHFYPIDSIDYISNEAVLKSQALWACEAFYPTQPPPTPRPTRIPLKTTTLQPTNQPTGNPHNPGIAMCRQNVLFLIEQSQFLLSYGYDDSIDFILKTAQYLHDFNDRTTFAYIAYNSDVVSQTLGYVNLETFKTQLKSASKTVANSDTVLGFNASLNFISKNSQYSDDDTRSLLYFITQGNDLSDQATDVIPLTRQIRSSYQTQVVGVAIAESTIGEDAVKKVIQYASHDSYAPSVYVGVNNTMQLDNDTTVTSTLNQLICKNSGCNIDLTFVIETSQVEGPSFVELQVESVINVIKNYAGMISPLKMAVSVIYFSSPDSLSPNQPDRSGILFEQVTDSDYAISQLSGSTFAPLGAASDLELGFELTADSLSRGFAQNSKFVVFFARGQYEKLANCCPDPSMEAARVRSLSSVQGVCIGPNTDKDQLDKLTGSTSIDANSYIDNFDMNSTDITTYAQRISDAIIPTVNNFINQQKCAGVPDFVDPPCEEPIDVMIMLHASTSNNWARITNFTATQLIPDLLGSTGYPTNKILTTSNPINFAVMGYYYLDTKVFTDFNYLLTPDDYVSKVKSLPFYPTTGTSTLSLAYKRAIDVFMDGRQYASKNIILITDRIDISDVEAALSEHDAMVQLVGGYTSALYVSPNLNAGAIIPGADYQLIIDPLELDPSNKYAERQLANQLTLKTCTYMPWQPPTQQPVTVTPTLPGPIPVVKARNVWPDMTILIDTSVAATTDDVGMTSVNFEKIRRFLDILLSQYSVGEKGSKFTIATFDGQTTQYSCKFYEINNYYDLNSCRNERLSFYSRDHDTKRDVNNALADLRKNVYESTSSGYRQLNENFLLILTLGKSVTDFNHELVNLQRMGIRTMAIGLSDTLSNTELSVFGQTNFLMSDWNSPYTGIDTNYDLADRIIQISTKKRSPSSASFYANLVFVVDQSVDTGSATQNVSQFVSDFTSQFFVDPRKTQVSIIPFANGAISPLDLTGDQNVLDSYLMQLKNSVASSAYSDIGSAITYTADMLKRKSSSDRPTYVIFVVGASNTTGSETAKTQLGPITSLLYAIDFTIDAQNYTTNLTYQTDDIFKVESGSLLIDRVVTFEFNRTNPILDFATEIYATQEATDSINYPLTAIAADIVLLVDETGQTDSDFSYMKGFLADFSTMFHVGPTSTQFALQTYNGRTIPHDGFHFYEATNNDVVRQRINQLTLAKAAENSTDADLAGAIEQEIYFFLTEGNGWRDDTMTYTIIFSHADMFYDRDTAVAMQIKNQSTIFAVGTNGQMFEYVRNFTNSGFYETVPDITSLSLNTTTIQDLLNAIGLDYREKVYPTPFPIKNIVKADFIFLVDNALSVSYTQRVRQFFNDFITNVATFSNSGNDTRLAVVNYGHEGVTDSWNLFASQTVDSLKSKIANINIASSVGASNLKSIVSPIDSVTSRNLNTRYSTFVIQTNDKQYSYVPNVVGTQLTDGRYLLDQNLNYSDDQFGILNSWISSEFSAWRTTFPDKLDCF